MQNFDIEEKIKRFKKDPIYWVEKNFELLVNDVDLTRENVKSEIEAYYTQLVNILQGKKEDIIKQIQDKINKQLDEYETIQLLNKIEDIQKLRLSRNIVHIRDLFGVIKFNYNPIKLSISTKSVRFNTNFYCNEVFGEDLLLVGGQEIFRRIVPNELIFLFDLKHYDLVRYISGYKIRIRFIKSFHGHTKTVNVIIKLNDILFASASLDQSIKVWNIYSGECLYTLYEQVYCLKLLPNDQFAGGLVNSIKIWNIKTGECLKIINTNVDVYSLEVFTKYSIIVGTRKSIDIIDITTGSKILSLSCQNITHLKMIDKFRFLSGNLENIINIWDVGGNCLNTIIHGQRIRYLDKYNNGQIVSSSNNYFRIWDINTNNILYEFVTNYSNSIILSNNRIICLYDNKIEIFKINER